MLLDGDHRPVADAIAWYDPRGTAEAGAFLAGPGAGLRLTQDVPPDATFSLFKLLWIGDQQPADLARATSWTDLGDFVLLGLGGDLVMDWSHASRAGAFDPWARAWDRDTIAAAGLDVAFPPLVASGTVIGTLAPDVAKRTGLPPGVRIVTGGHDHLCAAFGAGLRTSSDLFLSAGTSEAHLALLAAPLAPARLATAAATTSTRAASSTVIPTTRTSTSTPATSSASGARCSTRALTTPSCTQSWRLPLPTRMPPPSTSSTTSVTAGSTSCPTRPGGPPSCAPSWSVWPAARPTS